jgi:hypothetical protein
MSGRLAVEWRKCALGGGLWLPSCRFFDDESEGLGSEVSSLGRGWVFFVGEAESIDFTGEFGHGMQ